MPEQCRDPTTLIVGARLGAVIAILIVISVGVVVVTYSCCYILKHRECHKDKELEMTDSNHKAQIWQEEKRKIIAKCNTSGVESKQKNRCIFSRSIMIRPTTQN